MSENIGTKFSKSEASLPRGQLQPNHTLPSFRVGRLHAAKLSARGSDPSRTPTRRTSQTATRRERTHSTTTNSAKARRPTRRLAPKPMGPCQTDVPNGFKSTCYTVPQRVEAHTARTDSFAVRPQLRTRSLARRGPTSEPQNAKPFAPVVSERVAGNTDALSMRPPTSNRNYPRERFPTISLRHALERLRRSSAGAEDRLRLTGRPVGPVAWTDASTAS